MLRWPSRGGMSLCGPIARCGVLELEKVSELALAKTVLYVVSEDYQ
jgi:hypothetical protein